MKIAIEIGMEVQPVRYYAWITLGVGMEKSIEIRFIGFYGVIAVEPMFHRFFG